MNNTLIKRLINNSSTLTYRGVETKRKMLSYNYEDFNNLPQINYKDFEKIKKYFDIPVFYDTLFINIYQNGDKIGKHKDKIKNMDPSIKVVSVSIGLDENMKIINNDNLDLGYMEIEEEKQRIINNKPIIFNGYMEEHKAYTKKSKLFKYRVNFTFRAKYEENKCENLCENCEKIDGNCSKNMAIQMFFLSQMYDNLEK